MKRYLFWFANEHLDFRLAEIKSIASMLQVKLNWVVEPARDPYWLVDLEGDGDAKKILSRSVSLRHISELWAASDTLADLHDQLRNLPPHLVQSIASPDLSFKIKVETFCNSQTQQEKVNKIESFSYLPLRGPVKLKSPDIALNYIEYYGLDPNHIPHQPNKLFFARMVGEAQRDRISKLSLKKRKFIGNTSMDPQLSLIMANLAQVNHNDIVLDPFVGSGSLLIAAAEFGGYVLGTDIDFLMLHGKTRPTRKQHRERAREDESVLTNMKQYGLEGRYLDVVVADASLPVWAPHLKLDAIVADPPYGMREAMERVGTEVDRKISPEHLATHLPSKVVYSMERLISDLLSFAAYRLHLGRRLVTWIPVIRSEYEERCVPVHPCLTLESNCEQLLSSASSRRLLTYLKIKEPQGGEKAEVRWREESFRERYLREVELIRNGRKKNS